MRDNTLLLLGSSNGLFVYNLIDMKLIKRITTANIIICFLIIDNNTVLCGEEKSTFEIVDLKDFKKNKNIIRLCTHIYKSSIIKMEWSIFLNKNEFIASTSVGLLFKKLSSDDKIIIFV